MKLKAFFRSIYSTVRLTCIAQDQLGENASPAMVDVVISLTSIPSRLSTLHLTIKSLLNQEVSFEKIILWLHRDLESSLPPGFAKITGEAFRDPVLRDYRAPQEADRNPETAS